VIYYNEIVIYYSEPQIYKSTCITYNHRIHLYYNASHSIAHFLHIILKRNIFTCHIIIAFHSILIARMAKPTGKTKKTIEVKLGSLTKAGTKGKKRSASLKNIALLISNKQKKSRGSSSDATNLAAATHDSDTDSIVDQDDDVDVVLAGIPNHSFLSPQALQGDILDNDVNKEDDNNDNDDNNDDNHFGMEYNATVYDGRENSVAAVYQARLSASPSSANVAASIAPDLFTLSRNGLIAAVNEALRVQKSLECEVAALQQTMLSMQNQSQINNSAISGYQEGALIVGKSNRWLKRKDLCIISPIMVHYVVKEVFRKQKLVFLLKM
jgi:hypothetical protein